MQIRLHHFNGIILSPLQNDPASQQNKNWIIFLLIVNGPGSNGVVGWWVVVELLCVGFYVNI